ncbi:unnamed protein product, partial [Heterosigma akashiwo]
PAAEGATTEVAVDGGGWGAPAAATGDSAPPTAEGGWGAPAAVAEGGDSTPAATEGGWGAPAAEGGDAGAAAAAAEEAKQEKIKKEIEHSAEVMAMLAVEDEDQKKNRIRVIQSDPNSHLSSAKTFSELNLPENLLQGIYGMGFDRPSQIQEVALPLILANPPKNLIGQAQSGSGKTVAFTLGMLFRINLQENYPQAICVAPTRELANQILSDVIVKVSSWPHPAPHEKQREKKKKKNRRPSPFYSSVRSSPPQVFVLDEADDMIAEDGHREKSIAIHRQMSPQCQTLFFSATFNEGVFDFAKRIVRAPNIIKLASDEELVLDVIKQLWIDTACNKHEVLSDIYDLLTMGQSIVFVRTKMGANQITQMLVEKGFDVATLHGDLDNLERDVLMDEFRQGKRKVLISTNVLARGVDVPARLAGRQLDIPTTSTASGPSYLHRIG